MRNRTGQIACRQEISFMLRWKQLLVTLPLDRLLEATVGVSPHDLFVEATAGIGLLSYTLLQETTAL